MPFGLLFAPLEYQYLKQTMKHLVLITIGLIATTGVVTAKSQSTSADRNFKFWVTFTDKKSSPYSILRPWDFLSNRSISRRQKAGNVVTIDDLPVVSKYVTGVSSTGAKVLLTSRWLNGALVYTSDSSVATVISKLGFVKDVKLTGTFFKKRGAADWNSDNVVQSIESELENARISVKNKVSAEDYHDGYGLGWSQISQLNAHRLHKAGYRGKGIYIAVFDAGFYRANRMEVFDSLFLQNRVLGTADMVEPGSEVYADDDHGTQVLSCLAANVPGVMIGTAPDASYFLIRTEDAGTETLSEEYQWLCAAEYADSAGVDVISSSLGYTEFDDARQSHKYSDLNGKTAVISIAANMAFNRGILVVNSAGNEGDESWHHIGAPADAPGTIAVAAVDEDGRIAAFSSRGPSADNRVKPDVSAMGKRAVVVNSNGYFIRSNGTSYSAPILAGALACLLQSDYTASPEIIRLRMQYSGNHADKPDHEYGNGLPDFELAMLMGKLVKPVTENIPFTNWPELNDTLHYSFLLQTLRMPDQGYTFKLKAENRRGNQVGSFTHPFASMYAARVMPVATGNYELEVSDGVQIWKTRFYFEGYE